MENWLQRMLFFDKLKLLAGQRPEVADFGATSATAFSQLLVNYPSGIDRADAGRQEFPKIRPSRIR